MKIIQISATYRGESCPEMVYGLGDDQKVYYWHDSQEKWILSGPAPSQNEYKPK